MRFGVNRMKLIAHRGNINGPNPDKENTISYINSALNSGFDVEVDVSMNNGDLYLGHDNLQEKIQLRYLMNKRIWVHCKTPDTFIELSKHTHINSFYQEDDLICRTQLGFFWHHSDYSDHLSDKSIIVSLEYNDKLLNLGHTVHGICSDYVIDFSKAYKPPITKQGPPFDLLILDIDGIMTDGNKMYNANAEVVGKKYCDRDFTAIKRFKSAGIDVCFLSGDKNVNEAMAKNRKIDFYYTKDSSGNNVDKASFLGKLSKNYNCPLDRIAYVGDDYYDFTIIEKLKYTYCSKDSIKDLKDRVYKVLDSNGGEGVIAKLYEEYEDVINYEFPE